MVIRLEDVERVTAKARHAERKEVVIIGDRANFGFKQGDDTIYLYGHWAGEGMMNSLAHALRRVQRAGREDDKFYGTRIAISDIVGRGWANDLGWGISVNQIADNEHSVPVVDWDNQTVSLYQYSYATDEISKDPKFVMDFNTFIEKFYKE